MDNFSIRLQKAMQLANIKQSELCEKTGIAKSSMSEYLAGNYEPKQKGLFKLAYALNVTPSYLMGIEDKLNEWDEKYNKEDTLSKEVKQIDKFEDYLKSLGYKINVNQLGEWNISKNNITATFSNVEFNQLKEMNATLLDSEIYKNSLKHYVPETLAAHRTDDCTQSIDESALTNSVQRLKDQAFEKHGVKYK